MKKIIFITLFLSTTLQAHTPQSLNCDASQAVQHSFSYFSQSYTCEPENDCATKHYDLIATDTDTSDQNTLRTLIHEYVGINAQTTVNRIYYDYNATKTITALPNGTPQIQTFNYTAYLQLAHTCAESPPQNKCQIDSPNNLQVTKNGNLTAEDGNVNNGYTCFTDSQGDLCGFQVPETEMYTRNGRNGGDNVRHAILHQRGGRNGTKHISGNSTFSECTQTFQDANPFADNYPAVGTSIPNITPTIKEGNKLTVTLEDGKKVDVILPISDYNTDGTCSGSTATSCLSIIEAQDNGKDYAVITSLEPPSPNYVYEATLSILSESTDDLPNISTLPSDNSPTQLDLYTNPANPTVGISGSDDGDGSENLSDSSQLAVFAVTNSGSGTGGGSSGGGDGSSGGGDGSSGGGDGSGTNTQEVNLECGTGAKGLNCETTQSKIEQSINKDLPSKTKKGYSEAITSLQAQIDSEKTAFNLQISAIQSDVSDYLNPFQGITGSLPDFTFNTPVGTFPLNFNDHPEYFTYIGVFVMAIAFFFAFLILIEPSNK